MFGITGPAEKGRLEPVLGRAASEAAAQVDERSREHSRLVTPSPGSGLWPAQGQAPTGAPGGRDPDFRRADEQRIEDQSVWRRVRGPIGSLILHLLPLLLLIDWQMSRPVETEPIPVQLVLEPPPPEVKPAPPQPQPKPVPPPPRGRIASEDLGEPEAAKADRPKGDPPPPSEKSAKTDTPPVETKPADKPQQTAAVAPPLPPAKPDTPKPEPVLKPPPKSSPAAHQIPRRVEEPANSAPRRARFPGPAATRDEYLAYMHSLIRQHYNLLPQSELRNRRGMTVIEFVVLDDGKIALMKVRRSSGYPDIDNRVAEMIAAVGRFPPLPQWFQGIAMPFEFGFPFPEALQE